ncbi:MAG: hypothetical protein WCF12_09245 [Propionicimonas sp.]
MEFDEQHPVNDDEASGAPEDGMVHPVDPTQQQEWLRAAAIVTEHGEAPEADLLELIDLEVRHLRETRDEG